MQYSSHICIFRNEFKRHARPHHNRGSLITLSFLGKSFLAGMLVIATCQRSGMDLVQWGEETDMEKDRLLEQVRCKIPSFNQPSACFRQTSLS